MKNLYLTLLSFICGSLYLNAQIPNSGFESWSSPPSSPSQWFATTGLYGSVSQYSPGYNGSAYAVSLNLGNLTGPNGGTSIIDVGSSSYPGFVINYDRPLDLIGFVKGSGLKVIVKIYQQGGNTSTDAGLIGMGSATVSGSDWNQFSIPINYTSSALGRIVTIKLQNNGGSNSSVLVDDLNLNYSAASIDGYIDDKQLSISPNPATNQLNLEVDPKLFGSTFKIFDQIGKSLLKGEIINKSMTIDISSLNAGVYFLIVGDNLKTYKVIKE